MYNGIKLLGYIGEPNKKYEIAPETDIVKYFESFIGNMDNKELWERVLDIFVDKVYVYEEKLVITFHFTDDKQELSYEDTLEMIENHKYLMDCVNDPETHVIDSSVATKMKENILSEGKTDPDFFQ